MMERTVNVTLERIELRMEDDYDADTSWLDQADAEMGEGFEADAAERKLRIEQGLLGFVGIQAVAYLDSDSAEDYAFLHTDEIHSGGLWGIESDSGADYFDEIGMDAVAELVGLLLEYGFEAAEITATPISVQAGTAWERDTSTDWAVTLRTQVADTVDASPWPRMGEDGRTVWACCESSIGPDCEHKRVRAES